MTRSLYVACKGCGSTKTTALKILY